MARRKKRASGFPGFQREYTKNFFKYPTALETYWPDLTGAEQKVLDYILRRTYGFQKLSDPISLTQFVSGSGKKNLGCGVSRTHVLRCLVSLESKGFIIVEKNGYSTMTIHLRLEESTGTEGIEVKPGCGEEVLRLVRLFEGVAPHRIQDYLKDSRQLRAIEKLVEFYGSPLVEEVIKQLPETNGKKYTPTITSPVELEKKYMSWLAAKKRSKQEDRIVSGW